MHILVRVCRLFHLVPCEAKLVVPADVEADSPHVLVAVPGQLTPNHLTPESSHTIFGQLTLYMK